MAAPTTLQAKQPGGTGEPERPLRALRVLAPVVIGLLCLTAAIGLLQFLGTFASVRTWFFWKLATLWGWELLFVVTCLALGSLACRLALRGERDLPSLERLLFTLAAGAVALALLLYLAAAARLLRPAFTLLVPAVAIPAALRWGSWRDIAVLNQLRRIRWQFSPIELAITGFGVICLGLIYLHVLNPDAVNHDAHWTHLVIAQDLAREGRLAPQYAGWTKNYPHLASVIYSWCFLVPGLDDQGRLLLSMHIEFAFFLGTLVGVVAATRWLTQPVGAVCRTAWAAFFLFPGIFIYDSNLGGSADHVAAFFMLPLFLAVVRGTDRFSPGLCALAGALAGAALITKYQTMYVTAALGGVVAVRIGRAAVRHFRKRPGVPTLRQALVGSGAICAAAVLTASPYFLENLIFYKNPVFPFMQSVFTGSTPTFADAAYLVSNVATPAHLRGASSLLQRLIDGLGLVFTFSFQTHYAFTNGLPYFGFLFTLLAPLSLLLPRGSRLRTGALVGGGAILAWSMTYLVDRNLQVILPVLVAVTAATIARIWQLGWTARAGVAALVFVQLIWGADFIFQGALEGTIAHIRKGAAGEVNVRETLDRRAMTRALPKDAVVLLHLEHLALGLDRPVMEDLSESQGLIDYHNFRTPRDAYDRFRAIGLTHLMWMESSLFVTPLKQEAVIFLALVRPLSVTTFGPYSVVELPRVPPPATPPYRVLTVGLAGYPDAIFPIQELSLCEMRPPAACRPPRPDVNGPVTAEMLAEGVDAVLVAPGQRLQPAADGVLRDRFRLAMTIPAFSVYLKVRAVNADGIK